MFIQPCPMDEGVNVSHLASFARQICQRQQAGWTTVQDPLGRMGPYAYQGNQWVSFDDKDSLHAKTMWIKERGLGGGMIWALDLDDFNNVCKQGPYPLLTVIAEGLNIKANAMSSGTMVPSGGQTGGGSSSPTTMAPTTMAPTTMAPTTMAPTTKAPTTMAPATASPAGRVSTHSARTFMPNDFNRRNK